MHSIIYIGLGIEGIGLRFSHVDRIAKIAYGHTYKVLCVGWLSRATECVGGSIVERKIDRGQAVWIAKYFIILNTATITSMVSFKYCEEENVLHG